MELVLSPSLPPVLYDPVDDPIVSRFKWRVHLSGSTRKPYAVTYLNKKPLGMHRLIMGLPSHMEIDHINGNGLDNRRENLRICTPAQNRQNAPGWAKRKCPYKGVSKITKWRRARSTTPIWEARICYDSKQRVIGTYLTPQEAAHAYDAQARIHHGRFACLNFPKPGERGLR